jgi:uncharacterized damage-inducible protein DinB
MSVSADALRTHLDYTGWATRRLLDAAARLSEAELTRDFGTADRSLMGTMAHTFAADRVWLTRVTGGPSTGFLSEQERNLEFLSREWPALFDRWREWAGGLTDESANQMLDYRDLKGNPWRQKTWQIVLHVVNHGSHHRGQASGFLRAMGHTPPPLDLIAYYREIG